MQRNETAWEDPAEEVAGLILPRDSPTSEEFVAPILLKAREFGLMQLSPVPGNCKSNRLFSANKIAREEQ
jgi:hypothetical protein